MEQESTLIEWKPDLMLEVSLNEPDDFLKVRETLTRIGVASRKEACEKSFCKFSADSWCTVRKRGIERMGWQESEAGNGENGEGENGHKPSNEVKVGVVTFA